MPTVILSQDNYGKGYVENQVLCIKAWFLY